MTGDRAVLDRRTCRQSLESLADIVKHDDDYLEWLSRTPTGRPLRPGDLGIAGLSGPWRSRRSDQRRAPPKGRWSRFLS